MTRQALIVGGGMGGLAAGLACLRAGWQARLYEQAPEITEVGAGIQLGPNATRLLADWGLEHALAGVAAFPERLQARDAVDGAVLGEMNLGPSFRERYGAPYASVHRADLQRVLMEAAVAAGVDLRLSSRVHASQCDAHAVRLRVNESPEIEGDALVAADGVWSTLRRQWVGDGMPTATGHLAYRALIAQSALPQALRSAGVTVWLGPRLHVVAYPVKCGEQLNVVVIVQGRSGGVATDWDQDAATADLHSAMGPLCAPLRDLVHAIPAWRLWALHDRPPMRGPEEMARGRVALLGDAAHPMRPYLAQGAGMAIEDAQELGRALAMHVTTGIEVEVVLQRYALNRWQRCAQVQSRAQRNGRIFHATGVVQWGRNMAMRLLGERLMDQPWLYR
ncbi:MAG TPA: FAD-dependent monooxygenase [Ramlibacter sp.]|nr:FAD-dependent monooxygenase [Ramlibacter sp.]